MTTEILEAPTKIPETVTAIRDFQEIVESKTTKNVGETEKVLKTIKQVKTLSPSVYDDDSLAQFIKARTKAISKLLGDYIVAQLTVDFGLVDPSLFTMKRCLIFEDGMVIKDRTEHTLKRRGDDQERVEIPLFARASLGSKPINLLKLVKENTEGHRTTTKKYDFSVDVPTPPPSVKVEIRKAIGKYYQVVSEIFSNEYLCDLKAVDIAMTPPKFDVAWIPTADSMNLTIEEEIIDRTPVYRDPALLMNVAGKTFLVDTWGIPEEEPFENFLREFTTGEYPKAS